MYGIDAEPSVLNPYQWTGLVLEAGGRRVETIATETGFRTQEQALRWASGWLRGATEIRDDLDERGSASLWIRDAENREMVGGWE